MKATHRQKLINIYKMFLIKNDFKVLALLSITAWVAHFFYFRDFGLYEDDYVFISDGIDGGRFYLWERLQYFISWPQGRPVGFYLASLFSFIGYNLGGLPALYLTGFAIVTLNSYLFYIILKRTSSETLALMGGLAFCLFPADTTKILLTHAFILQTSLTFLLVGTFCYLSNRKIISYFLVMGSLLSYESVFIVFFAIPLLKDKWNKKLIYELIKHAFILILMMLLIVSIRTLTGESRVIKMNSELSSIPGKIISSIIIGSSTSMSLFFTTPFSAIFEWNKITWLVFVVTLAFFIYVIQKLNFNYFEKVEDNLLTRTNSGAFNKHINLDTSYLKTLKLLITGVILLCFSYPLSFSDPHYPPATEYGRFTSEHLAATFGGSLIFACVSSLIFYIANTSQNKKCLSIILAFYLSILVGYHFTIQRDFKQSWQNQREFWTGVIAASPDIDEKTVILVVNNQLPETKYILTHSWADPIVLEQIYQLPSKRSPAVFAEKPWDEYARPTLFIIDKNWKKQASDGKIIWKVTNLTWFYLGVGNLGDSKVIILNMINNKLTRIDDNIIKVGNSFEINGKKYNYKSTVLKRRKLFNYLIDENKLY